ncbi:MAG: DUF485 domain-containing protein [Phycisphaerae bacterium]
MLHEPAAPSGKDPASDYKKRLGVWMFIPYALVYASFVVINLTNPKVMEIVVLMGLNVAVVFGFGLIILAMVLALIYNHLCTRKEALMATQDDKKD